MRGCFLTLSRLAAAGWVGAAVLFVVTSVLEQSAQDLNYQTKSFLALIRFPWYYAYGFSSMVTALVSVAIVWGHPAVGLWRLRFYLGILSVALATMVCEYVFVYRPLTVMTAKFASARAAEFHDYHVMTQWINTAVIGLCLVAAVLITWPNRQRTP